MFKSVGFDCTKYNIGIKYSNNMQKELWFYFEDRNITFYNDICVNIELLKAINKQCEELGWFE